MSRLLILSLLVTVVCGCSDDTQIDVAVGPVTTNPVTPVVNQPILLTAEIDNRSGSYSSQTVAAVVVDGVVVVRVPVDAIAGGGSRQVSTSFSIPTTGAHSVSVIIDPDQSTSDPDRNNNISTFSLIVGVAPSVG